ncbi:hypothetical protein Tco_1218072 [Tanacetum coccineum]
MVCLKVGFKPTKEYRPISKKPTTNTSGNKKKGVEPTKEVSNSNLFDVLNPVVNDVELGTNGGISNLASNGANSSGSSFWNVKTSSISTTPIVDKIGKLEKLIIDGKVTLMDDDGKPLKKVDYPSDHDSEDGVESVDNDMARSMASEKDLPDKIQVICDNLDTRVQGRRKIVSCLHDLRNDDEEPDVLVNKTPLLKTWFPVVWRIVMAFVIQNLFEVTQVNLTAYMLKVVKQETSKSPDPSLEKRKKKRTQTLTKPKPKLQGPKSFGELPKETQGKKTKNK